MPDTIRSRSLSKMIAPATCSRATCPRVTKGISTFATVSARKIPQLRLALILVQLAPLFVADASAQSFDSAKAFTKAQRAVAHYNAAIRAYAPWFTGGSGSRSCDEWVAQFCVTFDTGMLELPPEPFRVKVARDSAIADLKRGLEVAPNSRELAASLIRLLGIAGRGEDAVRVAERFGSDDLLGYALHFAGRPKEAEERFRRHFRTGFPDLLSLIDGGQSRRYRKLPLAEKARYDTLVWRFGDPLYLTPGNEVVAEAFAREIDVELAPYEAPELVRRFGIPVRMTRSWGSVGLNNREEYSEHWHPEERTYLPPRLDQVLQLDARVDTVWPIDSIVRTSGYAPPTIRKMKVLEHQATVLLEPHRVLVTGVVKFDTATVKTSLTGRLFLLDSSLEIIDSVRADLTIEGDSVRFRAEGPLRSETQFYSAEVYDRSSRFAARARYQIALPNSAGTIAVGGLRIVGSRPVVTVGEKFGLQIETRKLKVDPGPVLGPVRVTVSTVGFDRRSKRPKTMGWTVELEHGQVTPIDFSLQLGDARPGRYIITFTATDATGATASAKRQILVVNANKASSSSRR
ncbi:MAG TPA: hypothetical protein VM100_13075 [Longimicrobiales bacterium]|nr:hypothetical protein [Longimicrobiales bacterium]